MPTVKSSAGLPGSRPIPGGLLTTASRNAVSAVAARISITIIGMVLTPFVLHRLKAELYGLVVVVGSIYEYLSLLRGGVGGALRRYVTLHHQAGRRDLARKFYATGFWWGGALRLVVLVGGLALAAPLTGFFRLNPGLRWDAALGIAAIFLAAVISDQASMFTIPIFATGRTSSISIVQLVQGWLRVVFTVLALSLFVPGLRAYGGAVVLSELLAMIALAWIAGRAGTVGSPVPRATLGEAGVRRELFRYAGYALLSQVAALLYLSTDNLFIGRIYGATQVTHYSLGTRWAPMIQGLLAATMAGLTPIFTGMEARGEKARSRSALLRVVSVTSALAVSICLVPCVLGDLFIERWVGPEYRGSYVYMVAMLIPAALDGALSPVWMALVARGRIGWVATGDIIVAVANVVLSLVLALGFHLGLLGFALGNTVATLAKNLLLRPLAGRRDDTMPSMRACMRPFPLAVAGATPALLLLRLLRPVYGARMVTLIVAGVLGGLLALVGSLFATVGPSGLRSLFDLLPLSGRKARVPRAK